MSLLISSTTESFLQTTTLKPCTKNWLNIWKQWISLVLGGLGAIFNALLLIAILKNKRLRSRKEYRLTIALSFADFIEDIGGFIGGVYRLPHYYSETACHVYVTPMFCMVLPHNIFWRWSDTAASYMLVATAVDRYVAISRASFHHVHGGKLALIMIGIVYGISIFCMLYAWIMPIQLQLQGKLLFAVCSTGGLIDKMYTQVIKYAAGAGCALSVFIHAIVAWKVFAYLRRMGNQSNFAGTKSRLIISKKEIKFTITSLVKGACTLVFDSIPRIFGVYAMTQEQLTGINPESGGFGSFMSSIPYVNRLLNVFIYAAGQAEIRKALLSLIGLGHLVLTTEDAIRSRIRTDRSVTTSSKNINTI